jgi:hypothetical protein
MQKIIITISILLLAVSVGFAIDKLKGEPKLGVYNSKSFSTGVYFTTTTDNTLRDSYGGAIRVDINGQIMISPSTTINIIGE